MRNKIVWLLGLLWLSIILGTAVASAETIYIVQRGDTLASIARRYGTTIQAIAQANNIINPNLIYPAQRLVIPSSGGGTAPPPAPTPPPPATGTVHVVQAGETLTRIAVRYGVTTQLLVQANNISNPNFIYVGQSLVIPGTAAPPPPLPTLMATAVVPPTAQPTNVPPTAVPPTATSSAPLPTATPIVLPPPSSGNLLPNPSFEGGWYHPGNVPELQIPNNWRFEWDTGPTGFGNNPWDVYNRPEVRVLNRDYLPASEHSTFIWHGNQTVKAFKGTSPLSFRLLADVNLAPGTYLLEVNIFPDLVMRYENGAKVWADDPLAGEVRLVAGGQNSGWLLPQFGQRNTLRYQFTVSQGGVVTVGAAVRGRFALENNGWFMDHWSLVRVN
jgi:LysM repeat protein